MGTMFDIVVYHPSRADAERAIGMAMAEIVRLDQVLSHFKADSDLSKLVRDGKAGVVPVEPSLFDVIERSLAFSRRSHGTFDVTVAPLLRVWKEAAAEGRRPSPDAIARAKQCVGYERIETRLPNLIRLHSDCVEIDLGGIGKGYAVDRAIAVLASLGIRHALVNAGTSTIAAIGAPPGQHGWPIELAASISGSRTLLLQDGSISTSQQAVGALPPDGKESGEILDPRTAAPAGSRMTITVMAPAGLVSDALSTTLLILPGAEGRKLLEHYRDVSAIWVSPAGELKASYGTSRMRLSH
jgi:thiamine biosynthesis lipoprotein